VNEKTWRPDVEPIEILELLILLFTAIATAGFFAPALPRLVLPGQGWTHASVGVLVVLVGYYAFRKRQDLPRVGRSVLLVAGLALLLACTRIPFLVHHLAFLSSDRAVTLMMIENIREGTSRPVYFYGQLYQGSLDAYLYALVPQWLAPPAVAVLIGNLAFLAVFAWFASLLLQRLTGSGSRFYSLILFSVPTGAMLFVSLDRVHGFSLVAGLLGILMYLVYRSVFEHREAFLWIGFVAGLLFWSYQPSLTWITVLFGWLVVAGVGSRRWRTMGKASWRIVIGMIVGALPHLLSELNNGWINLGTYLDAAPSMAGAVPAMKVVLRLDSTSFPGEIVWYGVLVLSLLGLVASVYRAIERRDARWMYLPVVFVGSLGLLLSSGFPPAERYLVHYRLYGLFAVVLAALACQEARVLERKAVKWMLGMVFVLETVGGSVAAHRRLAGPHENERRTIANLRAARERVLLGEYWNTLRFAPFLDRGSVVTAAPSVRYPHAVLDSAKYYPLALRLGELWDEEERGLLSRHSDRRRIERLLRELDIGFSSRVLDGFVLYSGFAGGLSAELSALLVEGGEVEPHIRSGAYRALEERLEALPHPGIDGTTVILPALGEIALPEEIRTGWQYVLQGERSRITLPFDPVRSHRYALPSPLGLPGGEYRAYLYYLGRPVHEFAPLPLSGAAGGLVLSRIGDAKDIVTGEEAETPRGLPLEGLDITSRQESLRGIELTIYSFFDFTSSIWTHRYQQVLLVNESPIPLRPGENTIALPATAGQTIRLDTSYRTLLTGRDSRGSPTFFNVGAVLQRITVDTADGSYEVEPFFREVGE